MKTAMIVLIIIIILLILTFIGAAVFGFAVKHWECTSSKKCVWRPLGKYANKEKCMVACHPVKPPTPPTPPHEKTWDCVKDPSQQYTCLENQKRQGHFSSQGACQQGCPPKTKMSIGVL